MSMFVQGHGAGANQLPTNLGQQVSAASLSVVIASDYTLPVTISSAPNSPLYVELTDGTTAFAGAKAAQLPTNIGQQVKASSLSVTLASDQGALSVAQSGTWNIGGIPTSLGQKTMAGSSGVVIASDQSSIPVTVGNASLAVTQSGTWAVTGLPTSIGQKLSAASTSVVVASDSTIAAVQSGTWTVTSTQLPATLGQKTMANSVGVVLASDQSAVTVTGSTSLTGVDYNAGVAGATTQRVVEAGRSFAWKVRNDYTSTNVTTGAYVQLVASTAAASTRLRIFDSSGALLVIATGGAGSEVDQMYIPPGGFDSVVELYIPASTRVSIKSVDTATVNVGQLAITALQ